MFTLKTNNMIKISIYIGSAIALPEPKTLNKQNATL